MRNSSTPLTSLRFDYHLFVLCSGFLPQLTKSFAEATAASTSDIATTSAASSSAQPSSVIPQSSFIISSGPTDSSNNQNYILISQIGTGAAAAAVSSSITTPLASSPTTAVVLPNASAAAAAAAAASRNLLLLNDAVAAKTNTHAGGEVKIITEHHSQDVISSSTSVLQESSSLLDSDTNRPTRPSSSDSSLLGGAQPMGKRRYSGLSSRPVTVGESGNTQLNRLEQKRARNRDAARRCRERKIRLIETLEKKVSQLSETNRQLKRELEQTQGEVECLRKFVEQHFQPRTGSGCSLPLKGWNRLLNSLWSTPPSRPFHVRAHLETHISAAPWRHYTIVHTPTNFHVCLRV